MIELLIQMLYHSDLLVTTVALMSSQHAQVHNLRSVPMKFNFFEKKKKKKKRKAIFGVSQLDSPG